MQKSLYIILSFVAVLLLTGMGNLGGGPVGKLPDVEEDIHVRLTDRSGTVTDLTRFSMDGKVFISGKRGQGEITIFFKDLRRIDFDSVQGEYIPAEFYLDSGESLRIEIPMRNVFFGDTGYGFFNIRARDIRSLDFAVAAN